MEKGIAYPFFGEVFPVSYVEERGFKPLLHI